MSGAFDRNANPLRAAPLLFVIALLSVAASMPSATAILPPGSPEPAALTANVGIVANRTDASRGDGVGWATWLNLTGTGQLQLTWFNVSFDAGLTPDGLNVLWPRPCARLANFSWSCSGLRSGSYDWTFQATISAEAPLGEWVNATANATTYTAGMYFTPPGADAGPWIRGAAVLTLLSLPRSARPEDQVNVTVVVLNDPNAGGTDPIRNVTLTVQADPWLLIDPDTNLSVFAGELTVGSALSLGFEAIIARDATTGALVGVRAVLRYETYDFRVVGPETRTASIEVSAPGFVSRPEVIGVAAFAAVVLATVLVLLVVGQRRVRIDEIFLMHRSGILIQHVSLGPALKKDDDLVASMLVAIQEFVRDSFRSEATLDEFSFGGRRAAIVRGKYVVLAAIISRGDVRYLVRQILGAVRDLEAAHGPELANWDGRISRLDRAGPILGSLLVGGYRGPRAWKSWAVRAKERLKRLR